MARSLMKRRGTDTMRRLLPIEFKLKRVSAKLENEHVKLRVSNRRAPIGWYWVQIKINSPIEDLSMWRMRTEGFFSGVYTALNRNPELLEW
jgi:hypothetical protein